MSGTIIAIDGPSGTGKSSVAKAVAKRLGFLYFDTGAMYRSLTYYLMKEGLSLTNDKQLDTVFPHFRFTIKIEGGSPHYFVGQQDVTEVIRSVEVTQKVSEVASHPKVREHLVEIQREFGKGKNAVFEGRDIGTVVFPKATYKFFLTARAEVRAKRRFLELKGTIDEKQVYQAIIERDRLDSSRAHSPLKQAQDAHLIDTSELSLQQVIDKVIACIRY